MGRRSNSRKKANILMQDRAGSPSPNPAANPFAKNPFGTPTTSTPFGSRPSTPFGSQPPAATPFGAQSSNPFGSQQPTTATFSNSNGFGAPSQNSPFSNNTTQPNIAGGAYVPSPFGQPPAPANSRHAGFGGAPNPFNTHTLQHDKMNRDSTQRNRKPGLAESLAKSGTFVTKGANGEAKITKDNPLDAQLGTGNYLKNSSLQNPFQKLSDAQAGPASAKSKQGSSARFTAAAPIATQEEYATAVKNQLKKDGVPDLILPADFFDPKKRPQAIAFRQKHLESHQNKVRASLERGGLIDIKDKQIRIEDAIDFRGTCEDMCPVYEVVTRVAENLALIEERAEGPDGTPWAVRDMFVKRHARSSAGESSVLPNEVRTIGALERTTAYLLDQVLQGEHNLRDRHAFLWDRLRAIRRDFTFQSRMLPEESLRMVNVLETIARFHAVSHHLLARKGAANVEYSAQQEREAFQKTLISLKAAYGDLHKQGIQCENEPEFVAYWIIFFANDTSDVLQIEKEMLTRNWGSSNQVQTAISLVQARLEYTTPLRAKLKNHAQKEYVYFPSLAVGAATTYFDIVADRSVSFAMACVAEMSFTLIRSVHLRKLVKACSRGRDSPKDITPASLQKILRFDTEQEAVDFVKERGLKFSDDGSHVSVMKNQPLPSVSSDAVFSLFVERKRCNRPLLEVIRNNVFEEDAPSDVVEARHPDSPEGMFVDDFPESPAKMPVAPIGAKTDTTQVKKTADKPFKNPFEPTKNHGTTTSAFGQASSAFSQASILGPSHGNSVKPPVAGTAAPKGSPSPTMNPFGGPTGSITSGGWATATTSKPSIFGAPSGGGAGLSGIAASNASKTNPFATAASPQLPSAALGTPSKAGEQALQRNAASPAALAPTQPLGHGIKTAPPAGILGTTPSSLRPANSTPPATSIFPNSTPAQTSMPQSVSGPAAGPNKQQEQSTATASGASLLDKIAAAKQKNGFVAEDSTPPTTAEPAQPPPLIDSPKLADPGSRLSTQSPSAPSTPQAPQLPKVDPMEGFTKWFVLGDNGMMEDFTVSYTEHLVRQAYTQFLAEEEERKRKEEDDKSWEDALKWRRYNLGLKFFYRWRDIARNKALGRRATQGRDLMRQFRESQLAQAKAEKEAAAKKKRVEEAKRAKQLEADAGNFTESLRMLQQHQPSRVRNPADDDIRDDDSVADALLGPRSPSASSTQEKSKGHMLKHWKDSLSRSASRVRDGAMAVFSSSVRESRHRSTEREDSSRSPPSRSTSLGRSLPPRNRATNFSGIAKRTASPTNEEADRLKRPRSVGLKTSHFRLRAMGMIHMPNGQYLHESIAKPMMEGKRFPGFGDYGLPPVANGEISANEEGHSAPAENTPTHTRSASWRTHAPRVPSASSIRSAMLNGENGTPPPQQYKRKRVAAEDGGGDDAMSITSVQQQQPPRGEMGSPSSAKKQRTDFAETERIIQEMRETGALMEEGEAWYREQSELLGRGQTPWS
ncbi:hypothetical protein MAPG_09103 [Magnaporthiopsis poae ATCC 64411]|uniref:SAC3/GANP/THP3 conserved domain-containing protein n=1 Tax=Magnaporthiopsis poae (strain ATCC 64411 / 73-15) TaxID=644358 RepID=A0A0C4E926_MAGP6|nr:hypothetical protein MAPG_09103 [Magnaporthiopsis poae ATCC 64411]